MEITNPENTEKTTCEARPRPKTFNEFIKSAAFWRPMTGVAVGALLGFLYYYYVGCASGTCAITSHPFTSMLFGGVMGLFIVNRPCKTC